MLAAITNNAQEHPLLDRSADESCALYAIDDRQDLWRIDEIEATVRSSRQLELEASLGVGSRSALSIRSQENSGQFGMCVS